MLNWNPAALEKGHAELQHTNLRFNLANSQTLKGNLNNFQLKLTADVNAGIFFTPRKNINTEKSQLLGKKLNISEKLGKGKVEKNQQSKDKTFNISKTL